MEMAQQFRATTHSLDPFVRCDMHDFLGRNRQSGELKAAKHKKLTNRYAGAVYNGGLGTASRAKYSICIPHNPKYLSIGPLNHFRGHRPPDPHPSISGQA